jgi:hypothetical protein
MQCGLKNRKRGRGVGGWGRRKQYVNKGRHNSQNGFTLSYISTIVGTVAVLNRASYHEDVRGSGSTALHLKPDTAHR